MQIPGRLYSNLFTTPPSEADVHVESKIWNELIRYLPPVYTLPDDEVLAPIVSQIPSAD
ncbi:hypothetical protein [Paenibacillus aquistagni]|uniref:Uncharacterized protein n=1 Tax=Paenibacillus aquistagni TaxID=1852522 RepID=A0A1X7LU24_9BACL|nr:hypothetical protein [Paenibacillus aquistagni]SMG56649.1 hypothetical protein SAMN06295960_4192 [Paenibacillus aquistagni]